MTTTRNRIAVCAALSVLTAGALATGCGSASDQPSPKQRKTPSEAVPHGYVEGAQETAEQQPRLVVADGDTGAVQVLDLTTGDITPTARVEGVREIVGDGRFAYLHTTDRTHVVDTGAWMVDHGDHVHYYRARIRDVGEVPGAQPKQVNSDTARTAVAFGDGSVGLLDRAALDGGTIRRVATVTDGTLPGPAVPYREHLLTPALAPDGGTVVAVRGKDGVRDGAIAEPCPELRGVAVTRKGVVFGCADGALLVTEKGGTFAGEKIAYGRPVAAENRAHDFHHRPGSTTLAARAGAEGAWLLDVARRTWTLVPTGPVVAVNTAADGAPLLALTDDGVLKAYDARTGAETARTALLSAPVRSSGPAAAGAGTENARPPVIEIDSGRAYVNDAATRKIHEIDYGDDLRVARTFSLPLTPTHMVETGR
ncbi:hypothetical protein [Embleya hyalina]|uniref:Lipoprotein n=1 Tax=Embleya hyalina TaxID=516124 RepID=A0A401YSX2_9ACTN|nr:hypothetical protein [Embleya hyalina]GCD97701.1 lipoprotein [Embleya hyalina]